MELCVRPGVKLCESHIARTDPKSRKLVELALMKLLFGSQNKDRDALAALELAAAAACSKMTSSLKIDWLDTSPLKAALSQRCLELCAVSSRARKANLAGNIKGGAIRWSLRASHHNFWACADH